MKPFQSFMCTTIKDIQVGDDFNPLDPHLFVHTGTFDNSERGEWEECIIKAGSKIWVTYMPNKQFYVSDKKDGIECHAIVSASYLNIPKNI